jgi:hypothetical protein
MDSTLEKIENKNSNTKEEVFEPKEEVLASTEEVLAFTEEVLASTEEVLTTTEEVLPPKEDKPKRSLISIIKNLFNSNNKPINLKDEEVINNEKPLDDEKKTEEETNNKITQTLDVLVENIETRKEKTFLQRIFSFMLRPCSA